MKAFDHSVWAVDLDGEYIATGSSDCNARFFRYDGEAAAKIYMVSGVDVPSSDGHSAGKDSRI